MATGYCNCIPDRLGGICSAHGDDLVYIHIQNCNQQKRYVYLYRYSYVYRTNSLMLQALQFRRMIHEFDLLTILRAFCHSSADPDMKVFALEGCITYLCLYLTVLHIIFSIYFNSLGNMPNRRGGYSPFEFKSSKIVLV